MSVRGGIRGVRWRGLATVAVAFTVAAGCSSPGPDDPPSADTPSPVPPASSPVAGPSPSGTAPVSCVDAAVGRMSMEERAGQVLMLGTEVDAPRDVRAAVSKYHLGGVFLAGRSQRPAAALKADIAAVQQAARTPLLIALDQEGGSVQTLKGPDFPLIPSAEKLGAGPAAKLRATVRDSAGRLAGIGITINLAPVADTVPASLGERNPPIGNFHRQYGSDPDAVAADIEQVVAASQGAGVLTTVKHFPGLGRTRANTDTSDDATDPTTTAADPYLKPFVAGIKAGTASVMISSASYPKLDARNVAAFSGPIVTGLLRAKLGFTGLVMSDDLGAADAVEDVPAGQRAVRFVRAGGDLVLTIVAQDAAPMTSALIAEAGSSPDFAARMTDAARHVVQAKVRAGLVAC